MQVRLVKPWQFRAVGTILNLPDGVAELLILRKTVARVDEEQFDITIAPVRSQPKTRRMRATA
jgi:hypothetical protein